MALRLLRSALGQRSAIRTGKLHQMGSIRWNGSLHRRALATTPAGMPSPEPPTAPNPAEPLNDACVVEVNEKNFQTLVLQASIDDGPVLIDFYAE